MDATKHKLEGILGSGTRIKVHVVFDHETFVGRALHVALAESAVVVASTAARVVIHRMTVVLVATCALVELIPLVQVVTARILQVALCAVLGTRNTGY